MVVKKKKRGRVVTSVSVPIEQYEMIVAAAELNGETLSGFFLAAADVRAHAAFENAASPPIGREVSRATPHR
jgi:uncharacterized protein (DUF1778 family)